jgi:hypothetical protein
VRADVFVCFQHFSTFQQDEVLWAHAVSSCIFPVSALESPFLQRALLLFIEEQYLKPNMWALGVLVAAVPLFLRFFFSFFFLFSWYQGLNF